MNKYISIILKNISTIFFISIIFFFCATIIFQMILKNFFIEKAHIQNAFTDLCTTGGYKSYTVNETDWSSIYPYASYSEKSEMQETSVVGKEEVIVSLPIINDERYNKIKAKVLNIEANLSNYSRDFLMFCEDIQAISGFFDKTIGNKMLSTDEAYYITSSGGCITYNPFIVSKEIEVDKDYIEKTLEPIVDMDEYLKTKNIPFLYVQTPVRYDEKLETIIGHSLDDIQATYVVNFLTEKGVDCLDLRKSAKEQSVDTFTLFSSTEGHWNTYGGFWAANQVSKELKDRYDLAYDDYYYELNNYEELTYHNYLLGGVGRAVTKAVIPKVDLTFYLPKYATDYELYIPSYVGVPTEGEFKDIMLDYDSLRVSNYFQNQYGAMLYLKPDYFSLHNIGNVPNKGIRVLLIRESFSSVFIPYFSTQYEYVDAITPQKFNGSIWTYIDETKPDVVIVLYTVHINDEWYNVY